MLHGDDPHNGPHDGDPDYDPNGYHIHADLSIYVEGELVTIPTGLGNALGGDFHTHDDTNRLHLHPGSPSGDFFTLDDWFNVWRTDPVLGDTGAEFNANQLFENVVDADHQLRMWVNGTEVFDFEEYKIHDEDDISIAYTSNPIITFNTNVGSIPIELFEDEVPTTMANLRSYYDQYPGTIFHRAAETQGGEEFVIQAGGFAPTDIRTTDGAVLQASAITTSDPIGDEPNRSNTFGTVAMAKNSLGATSQWFINLGDNSGLDAQGFGVFGRVLDMTVPNAIAALETQNLGGAFVTTPYTAVGELVVIESLEGDEQIDPGVITGAVYNDLDRDGTRDPGEPGVASVVVYSDTNQDGDRDAGEPSTTSSADGTYSLELALGSHEVRIDPDNGVTQTEPTGPLHYSVSVSNGETFANRNFGTVKPAVDDSATVDEDSGDTAIDVLANDLPAAGQTATLVSVFGFSDGGSASIQGGQILYTPAANFFGTESFQYTMNNGSGTTDIATVTVVVNGVNDPPTANDDQFQVFSGTSTTRLDVTDNDDIAPDENETLSVSLPVTSLPSGATVSVTSDGRGINYTPPSDTFSGMDTFEYTLSDGNGGTDTGTVTVDVSDATARSIMGAITGPGVPTVGGLQISLSGVDESGNEVERATKTKSDGSYEFDELPPGEYSVETGEMPFLSAPQAPLTVVSDTNDGDSVGNDFAQQGIRSSFISLRFELASTPREQILVAGKPDEAHAWHQLADGWRGVSVSEIVLSPNRETISLTANDGVEKNVTIDAKNPRQVEFYGNDGDHLLFSIQGGAESFGFTQSIETTANPSAASANQTAQATETESTPSAASVPSSAIPAPNSASAPITGDAADEVHAATPADEITDTVSLLDVAMAVAGQSNSNDAGGDDSDTSNSVDFLENAAP